MFIQNLIIVGIVLEIHLLWVDIFEFVQIVTLNT